MSQNSEKYHINPETGRVNKCSAVKQKCRFNLSEEDHYSSKEEARTAYEKSQTTFGKSIKKEEPIEDNSEKHTFAAYKLSDAKNRIAKANKKAERAGIPERITYEIEKFDKTLTDKNTGQSYIVEYVNFKVINPVIKHKGWSFVGIMSWDPEIGLVTRLVPEQNLIERPEEKLCDICGQKRERNDTYIVQKDGEQLQVGSSCLKRFTGITPSGLWMLDYDLDDDEFNETDDDDFGGSLGSIPYQERRMKSEDMLALAIATINKKGWVSRGTSYDYGKESTADLLLGAAGIFSSKDPDKQREYSEIIEESKKLEKDADSMLEKIRNIEGNSEYIVNLRQVASGETVSFRNMPLFISGVAVIRKNEQLNEAKKDKKISQHIGKPGDKITATKVKIKTIRAFESNYGYYPQTTYMTIMEDDKGNQIKWTSSAGPSMDEGDEFMLDRATIKKHDIWNDVKQTVVTRAKLTPIIENKE